MNTLHSAFTLLSLATLALSASLSPLSRVATYADIQATYRSIFKFQPSCPDTVILPAHTVDARQIALVPISSIIEDDFPCSGAPNMLMISEATVKSPGLLDALQLQDFQAALQSNLNANATVMNSKSTSSLLVGYDGQERVCGTNTYPPDTIHFLIREPTGFKIAFNASATGNVISIPPDVKALFITTSSAKVCLLLDETTLSDQSPTLTTISPDGDSATVALTTSPAMTSPEPSLSPDPAPPTVVIQTPPLPTPTTVDTTPAPVTTDDSAIPSVEPILTGLPVVPVTDASMTPETGPDSPILTAVPVPDDTSSAANADSDDSACFPASAKITLASGKIVDMAALKVGDIVLTPSGPSDVIMFTHHELTSQNNFLRLNTRQGSLTVTKGHYVRSERSLVPAGSLQVGDNLVTEHGASAIIGIEHITEVGLFNPQTTSGDIFVDGFAASTYTTAVDPIVAHALLRPVALLYGLSTEWTARLSNLFDHGSPVLAAGLPNGPGLMHV